MSIVKCFMLDETRLVQRSLRRYRNPSDMDKCPLPHGYHDADVLTDRAPEIRTEDGYIAHGSAEQMPPKDNPRWPRQCACGYVFRDEDQWQTNAHPLYRRSDTGELLTLREAPPGAIWDAWWMRGRRAPFLDDSGKRTVTDVNKQGMYRRCGPDGLCLMVRLPNGHDWYLDGPASNGPGWDRTGTPPMITATPSVFPGDYHGFLTNGQLISTPDSKL